MRSFLFGLLLGATAGILYAPANGKRTRSLVRDKVTKLFNDTADLLESKGRDLNNRLQGAKYNLNKTVEQVKPQVNQVTNAARDAYNNLRTQAEETQEQVADTIRADERQSA